MHKIEGAIKKYLLFLANEPVPGEEDTSQEAPIDGESCFFYNNWMGAVGNDHYCSGPTHLHRLLFRSAAAVVFV